MPRAQAGPVLDPATAPVHTDAEASGQGTSRAASASATQAQAGHAVPEEIATDHTNPGRGQLQIPGRRMAWLTGLGFALLILLGLTVAVATLP
jgi:hypothetical protein